MSRVLKLTLSLATCAAIGISTAASAQSALDNATNARHALMQMIAYHTGILGAMAKGTTPYDATIATAAAENLNAAASMKRLTLWLEGSEQGAVQGSRAKAEIWSDPAGFDKMATALETASAAMIPAAGTDLDSLRGAMGGVGTACGDCHKAFRGPKN